MEIWAVATVKNEQDVIGSVVHHLFAEGVDRMIVADNMSTDRTREILESLATRFPLQIIDDTEPAYWQAEKMTQLARLAGESGADWIIPFDADELWISSTGSLRSLLAESNAEVVEGDWYHHYAPPVPLRNPFASMARRERLPDQGLRKVAFRYRPGVRIGTGNHDAASPGMRSVHDPRLEVHHYRYRSFTHMRMKTRQGRAAIMLTNPADDNLVCGHWRHFGSFSTARLSLTWLRMSTRREGLVRDRRLPRSH
jgi:glycosyltransferase involved in cell wall biosynthesis